VLARTLRGHEQLLGLLQVPLHRHAAVRAVVRVPRAELLNLRLQLLGIAGRQHLRHLVLFLVRLLRHLIRAICLDLQLQVVVLRLERRHARLELGGVVALAPPALAGALLVPLEALALLAVLVVPRDRGWMRRRGRRNGVRCSGTADLVHATTSFEATHRPELQRPLLSFR